MALQQHAEGGKQWGNALDESLVDDGVCLEEILGLVGAGEPQPGECVGAGGRPADEGVRVLNAHHQQGGVRTPYGSEHAHMEMPNGAGAVLARKESSRQHRPGRAGARRAAAALSDGNSSGHDSASGAPASRRGAREPQDDVSDERKRNREAVRKYRARKKATLMQMEEELNDLRSESANLKQLLRSVQAQLPESAGTLAHQIRSALGDPEAPPAPPPAGSRHHTHLPSCAHLPQEACAPNLAPPPPSLPLRLAQPARAPSSPDPPSPPMLPPSRPSIPMGGVLPQQASVRSSAHAFAPQLSVRQPEVPASLASPRTRSAAAAAASAAAVTPPAPQPLQQLQPAQRQPRQLPPQLPPQHLPPPLPQPVPQPPQQLLLPQLPSAAPSPAPRTTNVTCNGNTNLGPAATFASLFAATTCMLGKHMGDKSAPLTAAAGSGLQKKQRIA